MICTATRHQSLLPDGNLWPTARLICEFFFKFFIHKYYNNSTYLCIFQLHTNLDIMYLDIGNKTLLPLWGFTNHITYNIVNYLIWWTKRVRQTCLLYQGLSVCPNIVRDSVVRKSAPYPKREVSYTVFFWKNDYKKHSKFLNDLSFPSKPLLIYII